MRVKIMLALLWVILPFNKMDKRGQKSAYRLTVQVSGCRNDKGKIYASLFNGKAGFPKEPAKAFALKNGLIVQGACKLLFDQVPEGTYAVACYHDENNNGKFDLNFWGIPLEGSAASNNAKGFMGPPSFKDARFELASDKSIEITINY